MKMNLKPVETGENLSYDGRSHADNTTPVSQSADASIAFERERRKNPTTHGQRQTTSSSRQAAKNGKRSSAHSVSKLAQGHGRLGIVKPGEELPFHPCTEKYPILDVDLAAMIESLRGDGQADPITVLERDGKRELIDGRTRYLAAQQLGIELRAVTLIPADAFNAPEWVAAKFRASGKARHLTKAQLAILAAELVPDFAEEAAKRMAAGIEAKPGETGRSHEKAAAKVGANPSAVRQGLKVILHSYLKDAVMKGEVAISTAARIADLPDESKRKEALAAAKKKDLAALNRLLETASKSTDEEGRSIPPGLLNVFGIGARLRKLAKQVDAVADAIEQIGQNDDAEFVSAVNITKLREQSTNICDVIPYCVCAACDADGDTCPWCDQRGWMTRKRHADWKNSSRRRQA